MTDQQIDKQVQALMKKMSIEEKAGQCNQSGLGPYEKTIVSQFGLGHFVSQLGGGTTAEQAAGHHNNLQKLAKDKGPHGIPIMIGCDGILDARAADAVTYPQQMGMGSTWNPGLVESIYLSIAEELRACGYSRTYTPNAGLSRDPRFGRAGECFSEDPYLASVLTSSAVYGLQGRDVSTGVLATPKHYAAYDASMGGKDSTDMDISDRQLRSIWLPPFKAAVDAGAGAIMNAYHSVNGMPLAANRYLLTDILKNELGFHGFVVTDFMCIESLAGGQHVAADVDEATKMAFEAGVDVHDHDLDGTFPERLAKLVREGKISKKVLDAACARTLRLKFKLGLFDNPFVDPKAAASIVGSKQHLDIELNAARQSMVLLKNQGGLLPLRKDLKSIAIIGPNADNSQNQLGVWTRDAASQQERIITVLEGVRQLLPQTKINYAKGCEIVKGYTKLENPAFSHDGGNGEQPGLKGEYFNSPDLTGTPALVRVDATVDFDWAGGAVAPGVNADNFSVRWTGKLQVPGSGIYHLRTTVDDGVRVWVDGQAVIDAWPDHVGTNSGSVKLEGGRKHDIKIEFHDTLGEARVKFAIEQPSFDDDTIAEAVNAAKQSEAAIVVVGDSPILNSEAHDRADMNLTGSQDKLVQAILDTGVPTVVVLVNARPLTINAINESAPAILEAWNPGEFGGQAVAETLFGDNNPGGKLPATWARSMGQLPVYYDYLPGWHGGSYADGTNPGPLYPFGFGLSYTTFDYSNLSVSPAKIPTSGKATVSVDIQNTGQVAGDEVAQLYIRDTVSSVVRPNKQLKGFQRISLKPGEKKTVQFTITPDDLAFYNQQMKWTVEPGSFDILVGGDSVSVKTTALAVD
ncbi:MAG: glycoside hydrolase family 3 C-terminal domain-containing protein [Armatimonadota bacterium]